MVGTTTGRRGREGGAPGRARLRDIAEQAGVSVNTVSRALTGKADVSARTRALVQSIARRLDYTPNILARSLVQGLTQTVGLMVTDCTDPYYARLIRAVEEVSSRRGFGLLLATSNDDLAKERRGLTMLRERRVDGLLLTAVDVDAPHVRRLGRQRLPTVLLSRRPQGYRGPFVATDNVEGARLAVGHLLRLGHRRIAHLSRDGTASSARERRRGYRAALAEAGLAPAPELLVRAAPTIDGGRAGAAQLLALRSRPTAVFAYSDLQAIGIVLALREAGLEVPGDLSVIGFDDIEPATIVEPPLTTIAQQIERIGRQGAEILIDLVRGASPAAVSVPIEPTLIERRTTAAPPATRRRGYALSRSAR